MSVPYDIDPDDFPLPPDYPDPPPYALPGLGSFLVPRYTSNIAFSEEVQVLDALDVIFTSSRMYLSQGANGKVRMHNKKPADFALGTAAFASLDTVLELDDVSAWVADSGNYLLIDPHTDDSEVRTLASAEYPTSQNSVGLTTSATGTDFTVAGFSGADGASTPATATITVNSFTADASYDVTLDGYTISFTPRSGDTVETIAAFIAGAFRGHPATARRFLIEWESGDDFVTFTARFGTITLDSFIANDHVAPVADPTVAPTLAAVALGNLAAGAYRVAYTEKNEHGETLLSPYKQVTAALNDKINVTAVTPSVAGNTICWYISPEAGSSKLRFHLENDGSAFTIDTSLPKLNASLPPDLNRTGTEVMRVKAVFSDRAEVRTAITRSNVLKDSVEWQLGTRKKAVNEIRLKIRDALQDWRLVEMRINDAASIAKTRKTSKEEINGQAIDNQFQGYRIATGLLAEYIDANFFYKWTATREALLLEEGDVVCITDDGTGVYNLPVWIEEIVFDMKDGSIPRAAFTASKYASNLYDDSIVERNIPVATEPTTLEFA